MKHTRYYLLLLPFSLIFALVATEINCYVNQIKTNEVFAQDVRILSAKELMDITQNITVKILMSEGVGSGILIKRSNNVYIVLTNYHVIEDQNDIKIQTVDGQVYTANLIDLNFQGNDLAILKFESNANYQIAQLASLNGISINEVLFAGGYPYYGKVPSGFIFNEGFLFTITDRPLKEGYQLGYSNNIKKGMSGGPLVNQRGEVIGIHGINAFPILGDPFIFFDGSTPSAIEKEKMAYYSWAIPIQTVAKFAGEYITFVDVVPSKKKCFFRVT